VIDEYLRTGTVSDTNEVASDEQPELRGFKKWFMRQFWRAQQSQTIISLFFWATTLSLLIFARIEHRWDANAKWYGIPYSYITMLSLFIGVGVFVLMIGWFYDNVFALWKEHQNVMIERNPFATYQLTPRDSMIIGQLAQIMALLSPGDDKVKTQSDWFVDWVASTTKSEVFRRMIVELDRILPEEVPEFTFYPDGAVETARSMADVDTEKKS